MSNILLIIGLFALVSCGFNANKKQMELTKDSAIMGGNLVKENDSIKKGIVAIYDVRDKSICTGSLIGGNYVLTAAHCAQTKASKLKIVFGLEIDDIMWTHEADIYQGFTRSVVEIKVHPDYDPESEKEVDWADIALLKFSGSMPEGYEPVKMLEDDSVLKRGVAVTLAGYGVSEVTADTVDAKKVPNLDEALKYGEVLCEDESLKNCISVDMDGDGVLRQTIAPISSLSESEIVLNESQGTGTCAGDSGGPAYLENDGKYYLFGITSRGSPLCDGVGIYTNAVYYKSWINKYVDLK